MEDLDYFPLYERIRPSLDESLVFFDSGAFNPSIYDNSEKRMELDDYPHLFSNGYNSIGEVVLENYAKDFNNGLKKILGNQNSVLLGEVWEEINGLINYLSVLKKEPQPSYLTRFFDRWMSYMDGNIGRSGWSPDDCIKEMSQYLARTFPGLGKVGPIDRLVVTTAVISSAVLERNAIIVTSDWDLDKYLHNDSGTFKYFCSQKGLKRPDVSIAIRLNSKRKGKYFLRKQNYFSR